MAEVSIDTQVVESGIDKLVESLLLVKNTKIKNTAFDSSNNLNSLRNIEDIVDVGKESINSTISMFSETFHASLNAISSGYDVLKKLDQEIKNSINKSNETASTNKKGKGTLY